MPRGTILISACLIGVNCRYDGRQKIDRGLLTRLKGQGLLPVCPEQLGGLPTPRPPARLIGGDGFMVLQGMARVLTVETERDVTSAFLKGAEQCAYLAGILGVNRCILKARSPSCGLGPVTGVTAARLITAGYEVVAVD